LEDIIGIDEIELLENSLHPLHIILHYEGLMLVEGGGRGKEGGGLSVTITDTVDIPTQGL